MSKDEVISYLFNKGISLDYNKPMNLQEIKRKGESWQREVYNNIIATNNLVNIQQVKGSDLEIVDTDKYDYLMTYSFPCQDLSLAGKGKGMADTSTRSGMIWEVERILDECQNLPQILLMENVPQVHSKKHLEDFNKWINFLNKKGYSNFYEDLNAKNYGIPQSRNRCFMISILGEYNYTFPNKISLKYRLKNLLENDVDEKYYLSDKMLQYISSNNEKWTGNNNRSLINKPYASTINTNEGSRRRDASNYVSSDVGENYNLKIKNKLIKVGSINLGNNESNNRVYDPEGLSPTLNTMQGGHRQPKIVEPLICASRGRDPENPSSRKAGEHTEQMIEINYSGCSNTLTTVQKDNYVIVPETTKKGYAEAHEGDGVYLDRPHQKRGVVQKGMIQTLKTSGNDVGVVVKGNLKQQLCNSLIENGLVQENDVIRHSYSNSRMENWDKRNVEFNNLVPTLDTRCDCLGVVVKKDTENYIQWQEKGKLDNDCRAWKENKVISTIKTDGRCKILQNNLRIRKLTPKECFRLMGVKDQDFENIAKNQSNSSLYHLAGDSIVSTVLMAILGKLLGIDYESKINELLEELTKESRLKNEN